MPTAPVEFQLHGDSLPADARPISFEAREALSEPFTVVAEFATEDAGLRAADCLRKGMTVAATDAHVGRTRTYSGVCEACTFVHHEGKHFVFRVVLRPPVAALAHREDCRIYQEKGVVDVVKELLAAAGVDKVEWRLEGTYPPREYIVQYRESELDFMHRLLEDEGIFYFFLHEGGETTMIFSDSTNALVEEPSPPIVLSLSAGIPGAEPVQGLTYTRRLRTSSIHVRDYDFEKPQQKPETTQTAEGKWPMPYYEWPAGFTKGQDGERIANARLRALRRDADELRAQSGVANVEVGKLVSIEGVAQEAFSGRFVVRELVSRGRQSLTGQVAAGREDEGGGVLSNDMVLMPEGAPFGPSRRTKKPKILGFQTAVVTGPDMGEEQVHCDKYGRIKVRFHWDRVGQFDDKSSCWLRVVQPPMGGQIIIPRVGWEVAVGFFGGDPDKPFVQARVYNAERVPPYPLPATKTSGSLKSASSPGGAGFNEIKLGDSGGSQGFDVTAQKDLNVMVGHDQNEKVGGNETTDVKVNSNHSVGSNQSISVGGNQEVNVGALGHTKIGGSLAVSVGGNSTDNATGNYVEKVGGDRAYSVGGNMTVICNGVRHTADGDISRSVGAAMLTASIASISDTIGASYTENVSAVKVDLCKGNWAEAVGASKTTIAAAAELHIVKGSYTSDAGASVTNLIGGLHYQKVAGDYNVKAPMITLLGATGAFKGGRSELKLGGGPVVLKGSKVAVETALVLKMGTSLKLG